MATRATKKLDQKQLQSDLLLIFEHHKVMVAVGLSRDGVAIRSQDERVDASNIGIPVARPATAQVTSELGNPTRQDFGVAIEILKGVGLSGVSEATLLGSDRDGLLDGVEAVAKVVGYLRAAREAT